MLAHIEVNVWPLRSNTEWVLEPDCAAITGKWQHFHSITEPIIIKVIDDSEREREARVRGSQTLLLPPLSCCHEWIRGWPWWTWTRRSHWNSLIKCNGKTDWSFILIQENQVNNSLASNQQPHNPPPPPPHFRPGDTNIKVQDIIWASCRSRQTEREGQWFWLMETELN